MNSFEGNTLLEGIISVKAAIEGKKRTVNKVYVDLDKRKQRDRKIMAFVSFLKAENVDFDFLPRTDIDEMLKRYSGENAGNSHGGVIAFVSQRSFIGLEKMLEGADVGDYFVCLDGIEDPYNLGYCIRTLYAMGASGFILPQRNWEKVWSVVARASAGACELCDIALSENDAKMSETVIDAGLDIVCSALSKESVPVQEFVPSKPFVLFVGGEKRGISAEFMEKAASIVHIPYARESVRYSLPAASVCAVYASTLYPYACKKNVEVRKEQKCSDM